MGEQEYLSLAGTVTAIIYQNEENGYTVLRLLEEGGEETTVVGCIPGAVPGEQLEVFGEWAKHPQHGAQFKASWSQRSLPETEDGIYSYLSSGAIKGIGPATATMLLTQFGARTLDVIENEPERLTALRGFSRKKAMQISENFRKQVGMRRLMEYLAAQELRPILALRLYRAYGENAYALVRENPYVLTGEKVGAGFDEADRLALAGGFAPDSPARIGAAIVHELSFNANQGHVFIPRDKLIAVTAKLLDIDAEPVSARLDALIEENIVIADHVANVDACYLYSLFEAECYAAARLRKMTETRYATDGREERAIEALERDAGIVYAPLQRKAILSAERNQIMVLTGGPGTGKTTCVRAILSLFDAKGFQTVLAAPTGRAAKRLEELAGREAKTIHRLLEATGADDGSKAVFRRNENEPLKCDALILDETSMLDITLLYALLRALPRDARLILVGDADQLPSIGPGRVFSDIIRSGIVETVSLTEIFRQSSGSEIIEAAHEINRGETPDLSRNKSDFFFLRRRETDRAADTIVELCAKRLPENMHIPVRELQVLTPTRKGPSGTAALNLRLQEAINPPAPTKKEHKYAEITYREGDRVMQNKNNYDILWQRVDPPRENQERVTLSWADDADDAYEGAGTEMGLGVFNGDIGYIQRIDVNEQTITVDFDGRLARYEFDQLGELEHAWAMTVHKSQGSEYRGVVLAVLPGAPRLMTRSVLYTAVTRARELLVAVGDENTVLQMVSNHRVERRYSGLRARLSGD